MKLVSRSEARSLRLKRYFTGKACAHGHIAERQTVNCRCCDCSKKACSKYRKSNGHLRREYYHRNSEKLQQHNSNWLAKNPDYKRQYNNKWRAANPEKVKEYFHRRRSRENSGDHTAEDIKDILRMQRGKCAICKISVKSTYHLDHVIPLKRGGHNGRSNLQVLCKACNTKKSHRDPIDFMQSLGMLL